MRNVIIAAVIVGSAMGVAACSTTPTTTSIATIEQQVQQDAQLACGFIPDVATIAALIPGAGAGVSIASTIASIVCGAVANAPKLASATPGASVSVGTVKLPSGKVVVVKGKFAS